MITTMPTKTFVAKLIKVYWRKKLFKMAGTIDGFIDFAVPGGRTYQLSVAEAEALIAALRDTIYDVKTNCLHDRDALLVDSV